MTGKPAILVVDDDPGVRRWLQRILHKYGYYAIAVGDTLQGLAAFAQGEDEIVLAIVDMVLPGAPGLDLAAELGRRRPDLRVLYISGCVDSIAMRAIARTSPEVVLLKPFTERSFIDRVGQLITNRMDAANG
ncbi:MAG TPA: response regulator [Bryobacteraceae bacterium]|nr:response regulator [Bryobacteraceae bacterium]